MPGRPECGTLEQFHECLKMVITRQVRAVSYRLLALVVGVVGAGFLIGALYLELSARLTTTASAALIGGLLMILVPAILFLEKRDRPHAYHANAEGTSAHDQADSPRDSGNHAQYASSELAAIFGVAIGKRAVIWTRAHPISAVTAALAAGIAVGFNPSLRAELAQLLGTLSGKDDAGASDEQRMRSASAGPAGSRH